MKTLAQLTPEQEEVAWTFAKPIPSEDPNKVRQDFLGARIHRDEYNKDAPYGWVVEYVLNHNFLNDYSNIEADIFYFSCFAKMSERYGITYQES